MFRKIWEPGSKYKSAFPIIVVSPSLPFAQAVNDNDVQDFFSELEEMRDPVAQMDAIATADVLANISYTYKEYYVVCYSQKCGIFIDW